MRQPEPRSQPSWAGGTVRLDARHRLLGEPMILGAIFAVIVVDLIGVLVVVAGLALFTGNDLTFDLLTGGDRITCNAASRFCYADPTPRIQIAEWTIGVFAGVVLISVAASVLLRRGIVVVCALQVALLATILVNTIPTIHRLDKTVHAVRACDYGRDGECPGVRNLSR